MTTTQTAIPCTIMRGGTSRGIYCLQADLPADIAQRDAVLLRIIGGPDSLQIDGIGGGHALTNKIAVVSPARENDADIDYLFLQATPAESRISDNQNCGNILAGVGPFAIEAGLLAADSPTTTMRVRMRNTGSLCELTVETPGGSVRYDGATSIDGVPGTAAPVICDFLDIAGSACGALLPTGNPIDRIEGTSVSCIDNGMPVVVLRAGDFGLTGHESPATLDANDELVSRLARIRLAAGRMMHLGDVAEKSVPKMCLVATPRQGGAIATRTFIPHACHRSIGVLGAVSVATACLVTDSVACEVANLSGDGDMQLQIEHPSGSLAVRIRVRRNDDGSIHVDRAGVIRTARLLMRGDAFVGELA